MTREELNGICAAIRRVKSASDRFERAQAWLIGQRDEAHLASTKAIYQAILDKMEEA